MRTDRYYYQNVKVNQDTGWFSESYRQFSGFSLDKRDTDLQVRTVEDYNDPTKIKTLATAVFALGKRVEELQINFTKIQNLAANVGGVLKILMELFRFILYFYGSKTIYFDIINTLSHEGSLNLPLTHDNYNKIDTGVEFTSLNQTPSPKKFLRKYSASSSHSANPSNSKSIKKLKTNNENNNIDTGT